MSSDNLLVYLVIVTMQRRGAHEALTTMSLLASQETTNRLLRLQLADTTNSFRAAMATAQTFLEQGACER